MSELSSALGGSAPKHHITSGDKKYPVSLITNAVKIGYEKALYEKARAALASVKSMYDKDYYHAKVDALVDKYQEGFFAMESEFGQKALTKPGGSILLLSLMLGRMADDKVTIIPMPEMDVITLITQAPEEVTAIFKTVMIESFPGVDVEKLAADIEAAQKGEGQPDPKLQAPAPVAASG